MKIFKIVLTCLFAFRLIKCADTSEISVAPLNKSEISADKNLHITPTQSCSRFCINIWVAMARFLAIPQKELDSLNEESRKGIYENYPDTQTLSDRFAIKAHEGIAFIFKIVLTCLFVLGFVKCADISDISVEPLSKSEISSCSRFGVDIWVEIAKFLPIPQKELGRLNKESRKAVYEIYPYTKFLSERFGITELEGAEKLDDLIWFKDLHYLKDPFEIIIIMFTALRVHNAFPYNQRQIARYIFRSSCDLDLKETLKYGPEGLKMSEFAKILCENGDYELLARVIERYSNVVYHDLCSINDDIRFIEIFSNFAKLPFENEETRISILHTLAHQFDFDLRPHRKGPFVVSWAFIAGFPRQSYIDLLKISSYLFLLENNYILHYLSTASQEKISEFRSLILENISSIEAAWRTDFAEDPEKLNDKLKFLNSKRLLLDIATSDPEEDFYETRIKGQNIFTETIEHLFFYSYRARKHKLTEKLLKLLIRTKFVGGYLPYDYNWLHECPSIYINNFDLLSEETRNDICTYTIFLEALLYFYNPEKVEISEGFVLRIQLFKKKAHYEPILPERFDYYFDIRSNCWDRAFFMTKMFEHYTLEDNKKFIKLFESIANCPFFISSKPHKFPKLDPNSYIKIIELFSESKELNRLNLKVNVKFKVDGEIAAPILLRKSPIFTDSWIEFENLYDIVRRLHTKVQFENFEAITQKDIASIFLEDITLHLRKRSTDFDYYKFRTAFRYWYEGPHRQRILEFKFPIFRIKFAREVETAAEKEFLLQGISEQELSQASAAAPTDPAQNLEEFNAAQSDDEDQYDYGI